MTETITPEVVEFSGGTDLIKFERADLSKILTVDGIDPVLKKLKAKVSGEKFDLSTDKGRKENAHVGRKVSSSKVWLLNMCDEKIKAEKAKIVGPLAKIADAKETKKKIAPFCDALRDRIKKGLTDYREAEKAKEDLRRLVIAFDLDHEDALAENSLFDREREMDRKEAAQKKQEDDRITKEKADKDEQDRKDREAKLKKEAAEAATKAAEDKADADRKAILKREADAKAETERIKREAKEAKEEAERGRLAAKEKAKKDKADAVEAERVKAKLEADQKERDRADKEKAAKAKADRAAANLNHQRKINREAVEDFVEYLGVSVAVGKAIVEVLAKKKIRKCTINY